MNNWVRTVSRLLFVLGSCAGLALMASGADSTRVAPATSRAPKTLPGQTATLLSNGSWLLLGGRNENGQVTGQAILLDSTQQQRQVLANSLSFPRAQQTATTLPDGTVLIAGGSGISGQPVTEFEKYHPDTQRFETVGDMGLSARSGATATLLTDGRLLIVGGADSSTLVHADAELVDSATLHVIGASSTMAQARSGQQSRLMPSGDVLIWGGRDQSGKPLESAELYDPDTGQFQVLESNTAKSLIALSDESVPRVNASLPQDESSDVAVGAQLGVRFSKPLQPGSLNSQTVTLIGPTGPVEATVTAAEGGLLAFITPKQQLLPGSQYTLFVQGAMDSARQPIPLTPMSFKTVALAQKANSSTTAPLPSLGPNDLDGELWSPGRRNLTGVWRSGQADLARKHLPKRGKEAAPGVTAVAGQVLRLNGSPLAKVTLSIGSRTTVTDANGEFLLADVASGTQTLVIDGTTADNKQKNYGRYEYRATIEAGKTNALPFVIWMTRLDTRNAITVPSPTTGETVVANPHIPGLELHIPAGTVIRDSKGKLVTQITMTAIPVDQPPFPLPNHQVPVYFTIQPGGAHLEGLSVQSSKGAQLIYPNFANSAPGSRIDFWNYDPRGKGWYVYGQGTVSADGKRVVPDAGVALYEFTGAMIALPSTAPSPAPPPNSCSSGGGGGGAGGANSGSTEGDPVDCFTGLYLQYRTDLVVRDVFPLSVDRTYRTLDTASRAFGVGGSLSYDIFLVGDVFPYTYQDVVMPDGSRIHFTRISAGTSYTDAVYTTVTPGPFFGATIHWTGGVNNYWTLQLPNGTVYGFPDSYVSSVARCAAVRTMSDRYGNTLTFTRDSNCNLTVISSPSGRSLNFTYDNSNRITQITDDIGRTLTYGYDASGHLIKATDANNQSESYSYDGSGRLLTVTDKRGNAMVTNTYDSNSRVIQQAFADGTSNHFSYTLDGSGNVTQTSYTDERGGIKQIQFNAAGYPTTITHAVGKPEQQTVSYVRDPATNLAQTVTDQLGRATAYQYDAFGDVTQVTHLSGTANAVTWSFAYEPIYHQLSSVTDPLSHTTAATFDTSGNITGVTDPLGNSVSMGYNASGQITSTTRYVGGTALTSTYSYLAGVLASTTDAMGRTTTIFSDQVGRPTVAKDPAGNYQRVSYDPLDRVSQTTDALGNVVSLSYDPNGNLLSVQDARNNTRSFTYDLRDRRASMTDALSQGESYAYDAIGNLVQATDRKGQVRGYTYDFLNRVTGAGFGASVSNPSNYLSTVAYTWDGGDRLTQVVDSVAGTITRGYDGLDRLTLEQSPLGQVAYTYYANGLRESMTVQGQPQVGYTFDAASRLTQVAQGSSTVTIGYDTANRRSSISLPNGIQAQYSYDAADELTAIAYQNGAAALGNVTYGYDGLGRIVSRGGSFGSSLVLPAAVASTAYDSNNRVTQWGSAQLTYDTNGNLTGDGTNTYSWDARNQLIGISGAATASFAYDSLGRRQSKTLGSATTGYVYDGISLLQEQSAGSVSANYLAGLGVDEVYARTDAAGTRTYLTDIIGSVLALADPSAVLQTTYAYGPYGATTASGQSNTNPVQFTSRENDGTGLYYYRSRYYSPTLGRFVSEDPMGFLAGTNFYAYVDGNPISRLDPLGLSWQSSALCFLKGAGVGAGGAIVIGIVSVGAVTLGAPVAAVTLALGGLAIAGGAATGADIGLAIGSGNWDRLAYDVGGIAGGAAVGGLGGRAIAEGINGIPSAPWSRALDESQAYNPNLGNLWQWLGTGPNPASAGFSAGAAGSGVATGVGAGSCGCR